MQNPSYQEIMRCGKCIVTVKLVAMYWLAWGCIYRLSLDKFNNIVVT